MAVPDVRLTNAPASLTLVPAPTMVAVDVREAVASTTVTALDVIEAVAVAVALPISVANPNTVILELTLT